MPKEKEKKYIQNYKKQWETDSFLKSWIAPHATESSSAVCKYCRVTLKAHKKDLIKHSKSEKHKNAVALDKSAKASRPLLFEPIVTDNVKIAEMKIAAFIAEHCAIQTVNHMMDILPQLDPTSKVISSLKLHRTKCSMIIKNLLGPCMLTELIQEIGDFPYSIIIDESTDIATQKILCIMIRFFCTKKRQIVTTFYRLVKLIDCNAQSVHSAIKCQLEKDGLQIQNMVGIGVDGASVLVGKFTSVSALFKQEIKDLIVIKCVCHSLHLCAEKASETLPRQLEFLVREAHNWFSYSSKRLEQYKNLYEAMNGHRNPKKIKGLSGTRWLARYEAINTILDQWEELHLLFSLARTKDKCYMAEQLYSIMNHAPYKAYLVFLKHELKTVVQLNLLFQSDNVEPTKLLEDLFLAYKNILKKLVVPSHFEKVSDSALVDYDFMPHLMHTSSIYLGYDFELAAQNIDLKDVADVRERCKIFLCTLAKEMQKRLPDNLSILKMIADLHPKIATSQIKPNITKKLMQFTRTNLFGDKNDIESEWHQLSNKPWICLNNSIEFYSEVYEDCDAAGQKRFKNISKFALALLTVPISNASVERAFSIFTIIKNKLRNRLSVEMLQSIMMVRFSLQRDYGSCVNFTPTSMMIKNFNINMYNSNSNDSIADDDLIEIFCQL